MVSVQHWTQRLKPEPNSMVLKTYDYRMVQIPNAVKRDIIAVQHARERARLERRILPSSRGDRPPHLAPLPTLTRLRLSVVRCRNAPVGKMWIIILCEWTTRAPTIFSHCRSPPLRRGPVLRPYMPSSSSPPLPVCLRTCFDRHTCQRGRHVPKSLTKQNGLRSSAGNDGRQVNRR